jgi:hypothetical protein
MSQETVIWPRNRFESDHVRPVAHLLARPLRDSVQSPAPKPVVDRGPWWEVVGQHPPGATPSDHVEDGVENLPEGMLARPATRIARRQQRR